MWLEGLDDVVNCLMSDLICDNIRHKYTRLMLIIKYSMTLNNSIYSLDTIEKQNDLGVIIDTKLSFDDHINQAVNKATKMTTIICRTYLFLDKDAFLPLHKTMVRTHFDYAIAVWYPYKKNFIASKEEQQKNFQG